MKDLSRDIWMRCTATSKPPTLENVDTALHFLHEDKTLTIHDKVAGDYDFEELLGLLHGFRRKLIKEEKAEEELLLREENDEDEFDV